MDSLRKRLVKRPDGTVEALWAIDAQAVIASGEAVAFDPDAVAAAPAKDPEPEPEPEPPKPKRRTKRGPSPAPLLSRDEQE